LNAQVIYGAAQMGVPTPYPVVQSKHQYLNTMDAAHLLFCFRAIDTHPRPRYHRLR